MKIFIMLAFYLVALNYQFFLVQSLCALIKLIVIINGVVKLKNIRLN